MLTTKSATIALVTITIVFLFAFTAAAQQAQGQGPPTAAQETTTPSGSATNCQTGQSNISNDQTPNPDSGLQLSTGSEQTCLDQGESAQLTATGGLRPHTWEITPDERASGLTLEEVNSEQNPDDVSASLSASGEANRVAFTATRSFFLTTSPTTPLPKPTA
jgi:predicted transglutaminase-like cysteine proteinase